MAPRLRFLGAKSRAEAVDPTQRRRRRLDVQLSGLCEIGWTEVKVLGREQSPRRFTDGAGQDRRVHVDEAAVVEEVADRLDDLVPHPHDRHLPRRSKPEVAVLEQKVDPMLLELDRIVIAGRANQFQVTQRELESPGGARIIAHCSRDPEAGFVGELVESCPDFRAHVALAQHRLHDPGAVPYDQERDLTTRSLIV